MATYEYNCSECDEQATIERSMMADEVVPVCSTCNQEMKRIYYAAPVKFNADGFYSTGG